MHIFKKSRCTALAAMIALSVTATICVGDEATQSDANATPQNTALPGCDKIATVLGDLVAGMVPGKNNHEGRFDNVTAHGVQCTWLTEEALSDDPSKQAKAGSLAVGITIDDNAAEEASLRNMGMVYDDPRVKAIGGFVVDMNKDLDLSKQLGIIGPQVVVGKVTITSAAAGVMAQNSGGASGITNDQVIAAAIALHKSL